MQPRRKQIQVEPQDQLHGGNMRRMLDNAFMSDDDTRRMLAKLRAIRDGTLNACTSSPELAALLCLPPDESPHSRMLDLLNQIILISGAIGRLLGPTPCRIELCLALLSAQILTPARFDSPRPIGNTGSRSQPYRCCDDAGGNEERCRRI